MNRRTSRVARIIGTAVLVIGIAIGASACVEDGSIRLPDRENMPTLTLPTRAPAPDTPPPAADPAPPAPEEPAVPQPDDPAYEGDRAVWWPFLVVAILGIAVVVVARVRGRAQREWEARLAAVRTDIAWVEASLVPQVLASPSVTEAAGLWGAARPRVLEIDQRVHALEAEAKDDLNRLRVTQLREPFASLVSALTAEASTKAAARADELRATRIQVELARAAVRASLVEG